MLEPIQPVWANSKGSVETTTSTLPPILVWPLGLDPGAPCADHSRSESSQQGIPDASAMALWTGLLAPD